MFNSLFSSFSCNSYPESFPSVKDLQEKCKIKFDRPECPKSFRPVKKISGHWPECPWPERPWPECPAPEEKTEKTDIINVRISYIFVYTILF
jgi:hypothetical protein